MKRRLILAILSLLLAVLFCPAANTESPAEPSPGPVVRIVPPPAVLTAPEPEKWVDIYTPDYDYAVRCGMQKLTVYWTVLKEEVEI